MHKRSFNRDAIGILYTENYLHAVALRYHLTRLFAWLFAWLFARLFVVRCDRNELPGWLVLDRGSHNNALDDNLSVRQ